MRDLRAAASNVQGALLLGLTVLLIWPSSVPDPFNVGALSWTMLCLLAGLPVLALALARRLPNTRLDVFLWIYILCSAIVLPFSYDGGVSHTWLLAQTANVVVFYGVVAAAQVWPAMPPLMLVVVVLGIAVLETIALEYHLERGLTVLVAGYVRPEGWNGYPELGLLACVQLAILIAVMQTTRRVSARVVVLALCSVAVVQVAFLYSRMAWVTAGALLLVAPVVARSRSIGWRWSLAAAAATVLLALAIGQTDLGSTLRGRLAERTALSDRMVIWRRAAQMVQEHPLTGVGIGNFQAGFERVHDPTVTIDNDRGRHAHNLWLHVAAEQGVPTAAAYVALWIAVLVLAWKQRGGSWVPRAALLVVLVFAVRNLGDDMFFSTGGAPARLHTLMWMTWGLIAAEPMVKSH